MANRWTPQQEQAIHLHGRNLLVSAAAGSGKTAVLVERIVSMITGDSDIDVDRLLVLTFTRAAAMEMKERIAGRINRMLAEKPDNSRLRKQITLLGHASITTIDSFCLRVVRDYFSELDLDPDFRVGDEGELTLLQADCIEELLERYYEEGNPDFLEFAEAYGGGKSDYQLEEYVKKVYRFAQSCPYPEDWMQQACEVFQISSLDEMEEQGFMKFLIQFYHTFFLELEEQAQYLLDICLESDGPYAYEEMMRSDLGFIRSFLQAETMQELCICAANMKFVRKTTKKQKDIDEKKKAVVSAGRDEIKKQMKKAAGELVNFAPAGILEAMQGIRKPMGILLELAEAFGKLYQEKKSEKNILDFNDLEHLALSILVKKGEGRTDAAKELQQQFSEILIDEYQDSNYLQDMILESISGKEDGCPNMFMVGDVKQSIYRFRMARPEIFMDKYTSYSKEDSLYQRIDLQKNFRSRAEVLEGINRIFGRIMTKTLGNIEYDADAALYPGANYPEYSETKSEDSKALKLVLIDLDKQETAAYMRDNDLEGTFDAVEAEAHAAAAEIREMTDPVTGKMVLDKETGQYHRASYRDIVILLRSVTGKAETYLDILTAEGIPACAPASGYFDALEVRVILSLLQIIDNPLQDIPLTAVMKSPIGNFRSDELAEVIAFYKKAGAEADPRLYSALHYYMQNQPNQKLTVKLRRFYQMIEEYRDKASYLQTYELIQLIYQDTGYYDYVSAMPAGIVRQMNLDKLVEKAIAYEKTSYHGLFHFVRYMEHLKKYEVDFEQGQAFGEQDDIVRIYSIHKSKGLEYPIVILGGLAKKFNQVDSRSAVLLHPDLGIAADYIDVEHRCKVPSAAATAISRKLKLDTLGEELRILYVAMTRAREMLIMTAADPWLNKHIEQYAQVYNDGKSLPFYQLAGAGNYLDWIFMAAGDQLEAWMEVKKVTVRDVFTKPSVRQAENIGRIQKLQQIGQSAEDLQKVYDPSVKKRLLHMDQQSYPYEEATRIQSKFSVSELKRLSFQTSDEQKEEELLLLPELNSLPDFMKEEEEQKGGVSRGTAYHRVLELIDPLKTWHTDVIRKSIEDCQAEGKIHAEMAVQVDPWKLYTFYQSELGTRLQDAAACGQLYREQQFILEVPAFKVNEEWESDVPILLQGVIDAFFEEKEAIVLLDYKTDGHITEEELKKRYQRQFDLYKMALEQISGKKVKEMYLWSFSLDRAINMES